MQRQANEDRQKTAHANTCDILPIALAALKADHPFRLEQKRRFSSGRLSDISCYFFPFYWPNSFGVGPFFWKNPREEKSSQLAAPPVTSQIIKTNDRGRSCGNYLRLAFWPRRCQPVWITTFNAALWARAWAQFLHQQRAATYTRALFWADCLALSATTSTFAASATNFHLTFRSVFRHRSNGHTARLAFFALLPHALALRWPEKELGYV